MGSHSASEIVQSLADVTRHADNELLDISITSSLYELLTAEKILLYKIFYVKNSVLCYCSIEAVNDQARIMDRGIKSSKVDYSTIPSFDVCLNSKKLTKHVSDSGESTLLYPITDKHDNIISVFRIERSKNAPSICDRFISGCFQIYQNYLHLLRDSERDTLTGLLNRKTFDRNLQKICSQQIERKTNLVEQQETRKKAISTSHWLAITDIDFFKRVNDDFGHLYGDEVLLLLSNIMRETFRGVDVLFRFGGEEFVSILRSTDLDGATNALERFRKKVGKITISIGFIEISENSNPTEIMGNADEALYFSKNNGRNQTNQYEQLILDGKITKKLVVVDDIELF